MPMDDAARTRSRLNRRRFVQWVLWSLPALGVADAAWWEPRSLKVRTQRLARGRPDLRFVHFTDLHFKGNRDFLETVVRRINALSPEFVCCSGDIIEEAIHLPEALDILRGIQAPLYGVPGNHDYWSGVDFAPIEAAFAATGGAWLMDRAVSSPQGTAHIVGASCRTRRIPDIARPARGRNILLLHYPGYVKQVPAGHYDLMLAGHSHGGQVRLPFIGALVLPFAVEGYDLGLFQTPAGPLYVGAGIGWFYLPLRFRCRPEITVFEL